MQRWRNEACSVTRTAASQGVQKADVRKNAAEIAIGQAEPLFKAAEYGDAIIERSGEIAAQTGTTPEKALLDHSGTDAVLIELAYGERAAEMAIMKARSDRLFPA